eukprot:CAMPEP_0184329570 /NCGR_PEP_ID=MMETSP1049-20130417/144223_1 /TAXON_ID=77928 /ORGANISM="Proteomonas sulcata, Strain CCMP704" /LENGTH=80 /DNA_ID=CAMNT_0026651951 /DNA_START=858 /DNA_END=1100 /DNA_ORIENTATION=-
MTHGWQEVETNCPDALKALMAHEETGEDSALMAEINVALQAASQRFVASASHFSSLAIDKVIEFAWGKEGAEGFRARPKP